MPRPRNQTARRAQLIAAATQTVLEHGAAQARLRDIAQQAGLTPASVLYYYPDVHELFTAVLTQGSVTYCEGREQEIARFSTAADRLRACIRSGVPRPGETADASRVLYELAPVVLRNETAAAEYKRFIDRQTALYHRVLTDGERSGEFRPVDDVAVLARSFVALEDGYGLDVLTGDLAADEVERRLLLHARLTLGVDLTT
ncbi:TetR/AcrR family transcriptional regulator [Amycolatopsis sacchari]|uniref:DNA-binding transcriptional regulator, AcrR family n=1 Tax=Amycolatopsis sacchari TaxID=115433 RepID=A0A1I3R558_9PSEU|nr:TetR/AcrR family transcriptional regulator [Amycolatopsis sacchari]SFJ40487.1 DNA-binding transcriptional regulator, AcrR family [Amycolatopsis sacchari]